MDQSEPGCNSADEPFGGRRTSIRFALNTDQQGPDAEYPTSEFQRPVRVASQRMSMTRRASIKLRDFEENPPTNKDGEQSNPSPVKQSASIFLKPVNPLSEDIEKLKTQDIQIDANSMAEKALSGSTSGGDSKPFMKRMSMRNLFGSAESAETAPAADDEEGAERKVEGREIKQDHELYALTYGMMLGIRVMTGRADKELEVLRAMKASGGSYSPTNTANSSDEEFLLELRDEDFSFGLELEFPPCGSNHSNTRLSFRMQSPSSDGSSTAQSPAPAQQRMPHIDEEASDPDLNFRPSKSLFSSFGSTNSLRSMSPSNLNSTRSRASTQSTRSSFTSMASTRTLGGESNPTPIYLREGTCTPPHKLKSTFSFKDYMPLPFRVVRALSGIDEGEFMMSVAGDFNYIEFIANSKSGQFFFYSHDGKYMIKTATKEESKLLRNIMPSYIQHLHDFPDSLLVRFYGMYRVKMDFLSVKTIYFVVMSSVFNTEKPIHVKYDLKGSSVGRIVSEADCAAGAVQKDLNLQQSGRRLRFGLPNIEILRTTLKYDAAFLASLNIMDYSLLVGVHERSSRKVGRRYSGVKPSVKFGRWSDKRTNMAFALDSKTGPTSIFTSYAGGIKSAPEANEIYFIGIIDILQLYNTGKRAETIFKSITENSSKLSSVPARFYANRFVDFIMSITDYEEICVQVEEEKEAREREWEAALQAHIESGGDPALFPREIQL